MDHGRRIGADFFDFDGKKYLLVVDYFSKFPFVERVHTTTAASTTNIFRQIFTSEGAPEVLITDNGPPFNSGEFKQFCQQWNLDHITSSPNHPQSDGQAERTIQTVKQKMARCKEDKQDFRQAPVTDEDNTNQQGSSQPIRNPQRKDRKNNYRKTRREAD